MQFKEAVSNRIHELCNMYNYTTNRLAEMSGIAITTLQNMLSLKVANPSSYIIYSICRTLKIYIKDFYNSHLFHFDNLED